MRWIQRYRISSFVRSALWLGPFWPARLGSPWYSAARTDVRREASTARVLPVALPSRKLP
jgi:hypothetical protein